MKTATTALLTSVLLSELAVASTDYVIGGQEVNIKLVGPDGQEMPVELTELPDSMKEALSRRKGAPSQQTGNQDDVSTTENWCGSAVYNPNDDPTTEFVQVLGDWTVPTISLRSGQTTSDQPSIAQWIGIDGGGNCATGLLQGGTVSQIFSSDGQQHDSSWWEFVPGALTAINQAINTGDSISANVTSTSSTSGIFEITNVSQGTVMTITIPNGNGTLCGSQAEWVLEDLTVGGLAPFAAFSDTSFTNTQAITANGQSMDASGGTPIDLAQNGVTYCVGSWDGSAVQVQSQNN